MMSGGRARWLAWSVSGLAAVLIVGAAASLLFMHTLPGAAEADLGDANLPYLLGLLGFAVVGGLIASRRPEHVIGWGLCFGSLILAIVTIQILAAVYALVLLPGSLPGGEILAWTTQWTWFLGGGLVPFLFLLFPSGRLPSPRWRPVAWAAGVGYVLLPLAEAFAPGPLETFPSIQNPFGLEGPLGEALQAVHATGTLALIILPVWLAAGAGLLWRFRSAHGEERQQLKWFVSAVVLFLLLLAATIVPLAPDWADLLTSIAFVALPASIGVAILRYRLYDIDLIINRALVYGALTAGLGLTYWSLVVLMQQLLRAFTEGSELAIIGSTLAVAALFQPVRRRVQNVVDRRFYRRKYDAQRTLEAFSARLRQETELDRLSQEMLDVVQRTMQPASASLWLRPSARERSR